MIVAVLKSDPIYMSKAFDKVWHEGLLFKLKQNGIDGKLLALLSNYLSNRRQKVVLNGKSSGSSGICDRAFTFLNLRK